MLVVMRALVSKPNPTLLQAVAADVGYAALWVGQIEPVLSKRRRVVAAAVSLALHGVFVALFLLSFSPHVSGGGSGGSDYGTGQGAGMGVELISIRKATPDALTVKQADPDDQSDAAVITESANPVATDATIVEAPTPSVALNVSAPAIDSPSAQAQVDAGGVGDGGQSAGVNDALWKQIEPCWRRLAGPGTKGTSLRINFSPLGNVAQTAEASGTGSDPGSEVMANQALAECGPYVDAGSRIDVVIAFPVVDGGGR